MIADIIHTHGGSELFEKVFQALSSVLYGDAQAKLEGTFQALVRISLVVGAFSALLLAFFRQKFEPLIRSFLLPSLIIVFLLLVPRTSISIEDHVSKKLGKPMEVPFFLGKFASITSNCFHHLHGLFKKAIGDTYPWTAKIYAGENFFRHEFAYSPLEEDFREFCRECVFRDLGLGLYSKEELFQAPDLMEFLLERTSAQRGPRAGFTCQQAVESLKEQLGSLSLKNHPYLEDNSTDIAKQKMAIDLLDEEIFRPDLKDQKVSIGALGSSILMDLQKFLEAVLYLIFPLIVLLSLLSFGLRTALLWIRAILWVSIWPIFYLAVDLFLDSLWKLRGGNLSFNLENGSRLFDLYTSLELIGGVCLACIPFLSWILIKQSSELISITLEPQETEKKIELETHQTELQPQDIPRQTHWEVLGAEHFQKSSNEDSFKTAVESSKEEERANLLQSSLASIREAVKDAAKERESSSPGAQQVEKPANIVPAHDYHVDAHSQMHTPSLGSWADESKKIDPNFL